eukprot:CFRG5096T1
MDEVIAAVGSDFVAHMLVTMVCGVSLRFVGEHATTISEYLTMGLYATIWIQEMSWIISHSDMNFLSPQASLGLSWLPETIGCFCAWFSILLNPSSFLMSDGFTNRLSVDRETTKKLGICMFFYSLVVWADSMNLAPPSLVPPNVKNYWWYFCMYGALTACLLTPTTGGVMNAVGIICLINFLQPVLEEDTETSWQEQMCGVVGCLFIAVATARNHRIQ